MEGVYFVLILLIILLLFIFAVSGTKEVKSKFVAREIVMKPSPKPEKIIYFEPDEVEKEASNSCEVKKYVPKKYNIQTSIASRMV
jgi:Na+-transporting methylmalonyl-CoA/oxaloacetate decarboxylase gamma subunit